MCLVLHYKYSVDHINWYSSMSQLQVTKMWQMPVTLGALSPLISFFMSTQLITLYSSICCSLILVGSLLLFRLSHPFPLSLSFLCNSLLYPSSTLKILLSFPEPHPLSCKLLPLDMSIHLCVCLSVSLMPGESMTDPLFLPLSPCHTADSRRAQDVVWTHKYM